MCPDVGVNTEWYAVLLWMVQLKTEIVLQSAIKTPPLHTMLWKKARMSSKHYKYYSYNTILQLYYTAIVQLQYSTVINI